MTTTMTHLFSSVKGNKIYSKTNVAELNSGSYWQRFDLAHSDNI